MDRLNTKSTLTRRHIFVHSDDLCVLCNTSSDETIDHLFFTCPFAVQCWSTIGFSWDISLNLMDRIFQASRVHNIPFFAEAFLIAAWELWKLRNDRVFDRQNPCQARWFSNFKNQCLTQSVRFKADLRLAFGF